MVETTDVSLSSSDTDREKNKTLAAARAPGDLLWLEACKYEQLKQKKLGWFRVFRGWNTTQSCWDSKKTIVRIPVKRPVWLKGKRCFFFRDFVTHTVDGSEILHQLRMVVYPSIYKVSYIPGGAEFLPSTVWLQLKIIGHHQGIPLLPSTAWVAYCMCFPLP